MSKMYILLGMLKVLVVAGDEQLQIGSPHRSLSEDPRLTSVVNLDKKARPEAYKVAKPKEYKYSVLVATFSASAVNLDVCSGSLLTRRWVLTAARCFSLSTTVNHSLVYAGGNNKQELLTANYSKESQVRIAFDFRVAFRFRRDQKTPPHWHRNVALVKTEKPFQFSDTVGVVKVAPTSWKYKDYAKCTVTGFGRLKLKRNSSDDFVRKTHFMDVTFPCHCGGKKVGMCGRLEEDSGFCDGDYGAGLVCDGVLTGVASEYTRASLSRPCRVVDPSGECSTNLTLSVFENICPHLEWISKYTHVMEFSDIAEECKGSAARVRLAASVALLALFCLLDYTF